MKTGKLFCVLDYETFSEADLKKVGGWEYSVHPSTEILCAAYRIGTRESLREEKTRLWLPSKSDTDFAGLLQSLRKPDIELVAHNAGFEQMITRNVFGPKYMRSKLAELQSIPIERWHCTAVMSRSIGLPGNLEGAGAALRLPVQKDKEGHKLMLKLSKPRKPTKKDPATRIVDAALYQRLAEYCIRDVDTEVELFLRLPALHPKERRFWVLNQKMNQRGFAVDRKLATQALRLIAHESRRMDARISELTGGALDSARQRDATLKWLKANGVSLPNLQAGTVKEWLIKHQSRKDKAAEILRIRDAISRSSTAKYAGFEMRSRSDGRARDNTLFFGAHTGRDAGTGGIQPQNLFKSVFKHQEDVDAGVELMKAGDRHAIEAIFDKPMELYASALRGCIIAPKGKTLMTGDFATIEVRVLFWLAGEKYGLKQIMDGVDLYCEMAGKIYNRDPKEIKRLYKAGDKEASLMRQLGKQTVLGAGFGIGIGGEKFQKAAKQYGMDISLELAQSAVRAYREMYPRIQAFWYSIEEAAKTAVSKPGFVVTMKNGLVWQLEGRRLTCKLPSGRKISYFRPSLKVPSSLKFNKHLIAHPQLHYYSVLSPSKVFGETSSWGGKLTENCVQAVARDCLYESLDLIERDGKRLPVLAVHDEIVSEHDSLTQPENAEGELSDFLNLMGRCPDWAQGLPVKCEGWAERRYRK